MKATLRGVYQWMVTVDMRPPAVASAPIPAKSGAKPLLDVPGSWGAAVPVTISPPAAPRARGSRYPGTSDPETVLRTYFSDRLCQLDLPDLKPTDFTYSTDVQSMAASFAQHAMPTRLGAAREVAEAALDAVDAGPLDPSCRYVWELGKRLQVDRAQLVSWCSTPHFAAINFAHTLKDKHAKLIAALVHDGGIGAEALERMQAKATLTHDDESELATIIDIRAAAATTADNVHPCVSYVWTLVQNANIPDLWKRTRYYTGAPDYDAVNVLRYFEGQGAGDLRRFVTQLRDVMADDPKVSAIHAGLMGRDELPHDDLMYLAEKIAERAVQNLALDRVPPANRRLWEIIEASTWEPRWKRAAITNALSPNPIETTVRAFVHHAEHLDLKAIVNIIAPQTAPADADYLRKLTERRDGDLPNRDIERIVGIVVDVVSKPAP